MCKMCAFSLPGTLSYCSSNNMLIEKVMMKDFDLITCNYVKRLCLDMMKDFESLIDVKTRYEVHNNKRFLICT